ncbi:MAG: ABC transporter ATP-binding protein [Planctomycetota bacterium]
MAVLEVENLVKRFIAPDGEPSTIIDVPTFTLAAGAQAALVGSSGSGKTTFLHLIAGILRADSGRIAVAGREITRLSEAARDRARAETIGYVFQSFNLLPGFTALENVTLGMAFGGKTDAARARELLTRVGLGDRLHYRPGQLSVGQQQRVAVARALANRPKLVLADEPTGNLDRGHAQAAMGLIRETCKEAGAALLLVSHDREILAQFESVQPLTEINRAAAATATTDSGAAAGAAVAAGASAGSVDGEGRA